MADLADDALTFIRIRHPRAIVIHRTYFVGSKGLTCFGIFDFDVGTKKLLIALPGLGPSETNAVLREVERVQRDLEGGLVIEAGHVDDPHDNRVSSAVLTWTPLVTMFTDVLAAGAQEIRAATGGLPIEIVDEPARASRLPPNSEPRFSLHDSTFISYGSPDETFAEALNRRLKAAGVKTWFFKDDALPGQKLHRMMSEGVAEHDRVLMICSRGSLSRNGVLNELERVLEREAREGGAEILLPVRLDDYVLSDWAPDRVDLASQIRSRVVGDFADASHDVAKFDREFTKVLQALTRSRRGPR